jgi:hypothetical protein
MLSLSSALDGAGGQHHAQAALPPGKKTVPEVQEAGRIPGPVWTGAENLVSNGLRSPDRLAIPAAQSRTTQKLKYVLFSVVTDNDTREIRTSLNEHKYEIWKWGPTRSTNHLPQTSTRSFIKTGINRTISIKTTTFTSKGTLDVSNFELCKFQISKNKLE